MSTSNIVLAVTATTTALVAGLLYGYACSVNIGLGKLPDNAYIAAMQNINRAIQNPVFFISFMGTVVLLPLSTFMHFEQPLTMRFWFLATATLLYIVGVFGVTVFGNVPLNNALDGFDLQGASVETIAKQRAAFEGTWNGLHTVRTVASVGALVMVILGCLSRGEA
jgi:uncharacterized membrane protein